MMGWREPRTWDAWEAGRAGGGMGADGCWGVTVAGWSRLEQGVHACIMAGEHAWGLIGDSVTGGWW